MDANKSSLQCVKTRGKQLYGVFCGTDDGMVMEIVVMTTWRLRIDLAFVITWRSTTSSSWWRQCPGTSTGGRSWTCSEQRENAQVDKRSLVPRCTLPPPTRILSLYLSFSPLGVVLIGIVVHCKPGKGEGVQEKQWNHTKVRDASIISWVQTLPYNFTAIP